MPQKSDPQNYHRRSIRLKGYDYTQPGGYFITVVTPQRECLFGEILNGEIQLNETGKIADECWRNISNHFPNVELGAYVVMPNHVHGIILIREGSTIYRAPTTTDTNEKFGEPIKGSIPSIIRTYKAAVTRQIGRGLNGANIWQRNYYEHIIRDADDHNRIHLYIESNPSMWEEDEENPNLITK